ncbi:MAG TPA: glycosyltransferase, partial [Ilumatobacteraceae bacterium]|nr:glycosyltransferase [Ilumatobacteraceae bacterium]
MNHSLQGRADGDLLSAIDAVVNEPRVSLALRWADELRLSAARAPRPAAVARCLRELIRSGDDVSALAAIHAIGAVADDMADRVLVDIVADGVEPYAAHAAWSLAARRPQRDAVRPLLQLFMGDGFPAMLAERTLIEWARLDVATMAEVARAGAVLPNWPERRRLADLYESMRQAVDASPLSNTDGSGTGSGLVVVQPCVHARIDRDGSTLGVGDSGGVASLLRSLGPALAAQASIAEVITVTRANGSEPAMEYLGDGHRIERLTIGPEGPLSSREAWQYRLEVEQQLFELGATLSDRRVVWHLRMADVGTLAAASVARRLGQAVVFTAAPDPHIVLDGLQDTGRLCRDQFGVEDAAHQYWFRARLVERIARQADHLVLLPRPTIRAELSELVGLGDVVTDERVTSVPEGVDVIAADRARVALLDGGPNRAVSAVLAAIPEERRGLPWLLAVGRMHPSKGAHRVVEAVAGDATLADDVNLVIVGGNFAQPTADERSTIERIQAAARTAPNGLVTLTGHLPPADIAALLAYVAANDGAYVCASDKEEFGLAIVEALAAGAPVVVPRRGGPQTYVVDNDTGVVCDTSSVPALRDAIRRCRALGPKPGRAARARDMVRSTLSIETMACALGEV